MNQLYLVENRVFSDRETAKKYWKYRNLQSQLGGSRYSLEDIKIIRIDSVSKNLVEELCQREISKGYIMKEEPGFVHETGILIYK